MEFCPKCKSIMFPKNGVLTCNTCGYTDESSNTAKYENVSIGDHEAKETVKDLGEVEDMRSTIKEICPECGHDKAYYELKQTRSGDEAPTRFFECEKCKHKWRAYD
ncbi:transcription factor S [Methanobrevibacter sp.]